MIRAEKVDFVAKFMAPGDVAQSLCLEGRIFLERNGPPESGLKGQRTREIMSFIML